MRIYPQDTDKIPVYIKTGKPVDWVLWLDPWTGEYAQARRNKDGTLEADEDGNLLYDVKIGGVELRDPGEENGPKAAGN